MSKNMPCPECPDTVRVPPEEVAKILRVLVETRHAKIVCDEEYQKRMGICMACANMEFGTTCRYSGYLVEIKARLYGETCPNPGQSKW